MRRKLGIAFALVAAVTVVARAQNGGAVVANAQVTVRHETTGETKTATTDGQGKVAIAGERIIETHGIIKFFLTGQIEIRVDGVGSEDGSVPGGVEQRHVISDHGIHRGQIRRVTGGVERCGVGQVQVSGYGRGVEECSVGGAGGDGRASQSG